jgi:hypothetical protein
MSQTVSQTSETRRLTLTSKIPSRNLPLTANIPKFTRAPQTTPLPIPPLPKPQKIPKVIKTAQEKKKEKISNHQKKVLKARVARVEKERGPLPEPEVGGYDDHGFWVEHPRKEPGEGEGGQEEDGEHLRLRGGHGEEERREGNISQLPMEDNDLEMQQASANLQGMPSGQTFDDLFNFDDTPYHPPVPASSTAPRDKGQLSKRRKLDAPETLGEIDADTSRGRSPTTPHINDASRSNLRHPVSAMRGGGTEEDDLLDGDPRHTLEEYIPMPESAQPRRPMEEPEDDKYDEDYPMLSPTEMNSSAMREPVSRSQTRRSNDRSHIYSLEPGYPKASGYLPTGQTFPTSFPVSDTQPGTPDSPPPPTPAGPPQRVKTYAKGSKSAPTRSRVATSRNPAQRHGFKDLFSPEPEWEEEHLTAASGKVDRSKRAGSTSWWPDSITPAPLEESSDEEDDEEMESTVRHILGEVEVNEKGQRVARGRKRNGPWPEGRDMGLFHEDTQDQAARPTELYRPVTERFHLVNVNVKEETHTPLPLVQDTPPLEYQPKRKHNNRANDDRPVEHPVPKLTMGRQRSVAERLDE